MPVESNIVQRVSPVIPRDRAVTTCDLQALFDRDPDGMYALALTDLPSDAPIAVRGLQHLARTVSVLMRDGFVIESAANQKYAQGYKGGIIPLDDGAKDEAFIWKLYTGYGYASKMESQVRSVECVRFYLDAHSWDEQIRATKLLRVAPDDVHAILGGLPRYQYEALLDCAREVVRSPSVVYKGLRHMGYMSRDGYAYCGRPSRRRLNSDQFTEPSEKFVFIVFVSPDGYVFDWDWVPADPTNPSIPRNAEERFPDQQTDSDVRGEILLGNLRGKTPSPFRPGSAWFSQKGDCVFWYFSDVETYADRYDEYMTVFFDAADSERIPACVGFKIKMVSHLKETVQRWARTPSEGIVVTANPERIEITLAFLMKAWAEAALPRTRELFPGMRLIEALGEQGTKSLKEKANSTLEISGRVSPSDPLLQSS